MSNVRPVELNGPAITTMVAAIDAMADVSPRDFASKEIVGGADAKFQMTLAEEVRAEALAAGAQRAAARSTGSINGPARISTARVIEQMHGALVETPGDLIATAKRLWPELWARIVERARAEDVAPGMMLLTMIQAGLDA